MYTYIIESQGLYKIGKATDVEKRMSNFKTGNPSFILIKTIEGDHESFLHKHFKEKRSHLEWFSLSEEDISSIERVLTNRYVVDKVMHSIVTSEGCDEKGKMIIDKVSFIMTESELRVFMKVIEDRIREQSTILPENYKEEQQEEDDIKRAVEYYNKQKAKKK